MTLWNDLVSTPAKAEKAASTAAKQTQRLLVQPTKRLGGFVSEAWQRHGHGPTVGSVSFSLGSTLLRQPLRTLAAYTVLIPPAQRKLLAGQTWVPTVRGQIFKGKTLLRGAAGAAAAGAAGGGARRRRMAIEIHGPPQDMRLSESEDDDSDTQNDEMKEEGEDGIKDVVKDDKIEDDSDTFHPTKALKEHEIVVVRLYKHKTNNEDNDEKHDRDNENDNDEEEDDNFVSMRVFAIQDMKLVSRDDNVVVVRIGRGDDEIKEYQVHFDTAQDALHFWQLFNRLWDAELWRSKQQAHAYKEMVKALPPLNEEQREKDAASSLEKESINLLVEIVSVTNLPPIRNADDENKTQTRNPMIIVKLGDNTEIHRTKPLKKTLDPIWALESGSLFLLQQTPEEFFASSASGGVTFFLVDAPNASMLPMAGEAVANTVNKVVGRVRVELQQLLTMQGERMRFDVALEKNVLCRADSSTLRSSVSTSFSTSSPSASCALYLRVKPASESDMEFMQTYELHKGLAGVYAEETYLLPHPPHIDFLKRTRKLVANGPQVSPRTKMTRVRPYPDPQRPEETKWMPSEQIQKEANKHSTHWIKAGSGDLGNLFVEVLGCDGLPNLSLIRTTNILDKVNPFVCLVFEDTVMNTDVIGDCQSPRWMPWSKRAFLLPIIHPQSDLFLGVFDYDMEQSPVQVALATSRVKRQHNRIGRCSVCLTQLNPNTTYTLTYPLYLGGLKGSREQARGTVTFRLRIHLNNIQKTMFAALGPPVPNFVSCPRKIDWEVAKYTIEGVADSKRYSMASFARYIDELYSYEKVLPFIEEFALTCLLWRGHYPVRLWMTTVLLPAHSMVAFTWALIVFRNLDYIPSFCVFCIAWVFLTAHGIVRRSPSPWQKPRGYGQSLSVLLFGSSFLREIPPNERANDLVIFEEEQDRMRRRREKTLQLQAEYEEKLERELRISNQNEDVEDIATHKSSAEDIAEMLHLQPFKSTLYPVQLELRRIVLVCRFVSKFFLWREALYSFWITTFALVATAFVALVPWGLVIGWSIRISAVLVTGPWWKLADWYLFEQPTHEMTDEEYDAHVQRKLQKRFDEAIRAISAYQIKKERAIKLKSMKHYLYGKFIIRIPRVSLDLFTDVPRSESFSKLHRKKADQSFDVTEQKYGQHLQGDMIPTRQIDISNCEQMEAAKTSRQHKNPFNSVLRETVRLSKLCLPKKNDAQDPDKLKSN